MASPSFDTRIKTLNAVLESKRHQETVKKALETSQGDLSEALKSVETDLTPRARQRVEQAQIFADWSDDNVPLVKALVDEPAVRNLRDVALHFDEDSLADIMDEMAVPDTTEGNTRAEKKRNYAAALQARLYRVEPSAVLQRMVERRELPIAEAGVRAGVSAFLQNQPDFNIRETSVYTALKKPEALKDVPLEQRPAVIENLKSLQRVQALAPAPRAIPVLMRSNLTSAFHITEMPEAAFLAAHRKTLGEGTARAVYTNAVNARIRNEHALIAMREAVRGTGLAILDGSQTMETRMAKMQKVADDQGLPLNLEALFGSQDFCECEDCNSVYSAASYFVELLQFLRNNNLAQDNANTGATGIKDTPLEKLFFRRPDLGCLELTCENTDTRLPYVDLVNEVMESFVVHLEEYEKDPQTPKPSRLEVFNVDGETADELLAQPQHTNYDAYCILKSEVYPFTLPYHQPIDATRIFLNYLGTSRYELLDHFRAVMDEATDTLSEDQKKELGELHNEILERAADAEYLGLTQEEYVILTRQAFWPQRYFEITKNKPCLDEYCEKIGVRPVHEYYGYDTEEEMLATDETDQRGLAFVKKQFLFRTGIQYTDLVDLLKTQWLNPYYPQGKALTIMQSLQFSYRFLQTLVETSSSDRKVRFAKLIEFLEDPKSQLPQFESMLHPDPCREQKPEKCLESEELRRWVYCHFEAIGNLIVLESGEGPQLPFEGFLFNTDTAEGPQLVGKLNRDGSITDPGGHLIGRVTHDGKTVAPDGKSFVGQFGVSLLVIRDDSETFLGYIDDDELHDAQYNLVQWLPITDTCDLEKVRMTHLNGTPLGVDEYDCMQRFIRLWRKLGWTIDEVDKALIGLAVLSRDGGVPSPAAAEISPVVDLDHFVDDCADQEMGEEGCKDTSVRPTTDCRITPEFLHQLAAVRKLLELTGVPLPRLLTFWGDISTRGEKSLYASLFLTHNLLGIDKVFQADENGNYLTQSAKLSVHMPVLMSALKMKADDLNAIIQAQQLADQLTLANVSMLYRHGLLAKTLHLKASDALQVRGVFGDPFKDGAIGTLALFKAWGKMEDAGFTFRQFNYLIANVDDKLRPLAPSRQTILKLGKTLFDGLNAIDRDHPDLTEANKAEATTDLVRAKTALLYDPAIIEQIVGLLEGTTVYTTNAPANQTITPDEALAKKVKYIPSDANPPEAKLQVTGILTEQEITEAKTLSNHPAWTTAVDRVVKQKNNFYNDVLSGIFRDEDEAKNTLLAGDVDLPDDQQDPALGDADTAPGKRFFFLKHFMPFLRRQLTHRLIVETVAGAAGLGNEVTDVFLSEILVAGANSDLAIVALERLKTQPPAASNSWKGYLIPAADDRYTFVIVTDDQPAPLLFDNQQMPFHRQQEDPSNIWTTDPTSTKLKRGNLYLLEVSDRPVEQLQWKTPSSSRVVIPSSALLPDYTSEGTKEVLVKVSKAAMLINGFSLSVEEVGHWQAHRTNFDGFDFNDVKLEHWRRLEAYITLRNSLPKLESTLLGLFEWSGKPGSNLDKLSERIAAATLWKKESIEKLLASRHFDLNRLDAFLNEINLVKMQKALLVAEKIAIDIDDLFVWAKPGSRFRDTHEIAESIRKAVRARFDQESWEQAVRPLNDQLRENQKQALISYLLGQKERIAWPIVDADSLFEFFLIDVQMDPCTETSRLKQAISSVQLFIQRCLLGLEDKKAENGNQIGVPNESIDRARWEWMQRYRVWEANRKVFLYPENWIETNLRDDKSPFFKELESELLQKDISKQNVEDALKAYLYKVDEVANMQVVGLYIEGEQGANGWITGSKLHVFSRTRNAPYFFYYRYLALDRTEWYPWEKMQVDIPSYDVEETPRASDIEYPTPAPQSDNGCYLTPFVWNKRLLIFFPQIIKKTMPSPLADLPIKDLADIPSHVTKPIDYWEIKMAWSEYRNGKWTQKQVSKNAIQDVDEIFINSVDRELSTIKGHVNAAATADSEYKAAEARLKKAEADLAAENRKEKPDQKEVERLSKEVIQAAINLTNKVVVKLKKDSDAKKALEVLKTLRPLILANIYNYEFTPVLSDDLNWADKLLGIQVYCYEHEAHEGHNGPQVGVFEFTGTSLLSRSKTYSENNAVDVSNFHYNGDEIRSLQVFNDPNDVNNSYFEDGGENHYLVGAPPTPRSITFSHPHTRQLLGKINVGPLEDFFKFNLSITDATLKADTFGSEAPNEYHELRRPYSIYNWELFFHTPAMLAEALSKSQHFEEAVKWYHYVFNPLLGGMTTPKEAWQFLPFQEIDAEDVLDKLFTGLAAGEFNNAINNWRDKPFQPHLLARDRPSAYMKWVVMKYIENLIAWGDYLFRQDTIETLNQATQLYVLAAHLYGPRPQLIPKRGKVQPQTYMSLLDKWDAFGNAMVEMELAFPYSNQIPIPLILDQDSEGSAKNEDVALANVFGFATTLYFCIPDNPKLKEIRNTIDDRLFKIRHCQNIEGVFRKLPLFEPPIDPALLVQAAAQGLSLSSVLNDLNSPMPNYRFYYLLQKALELCSELKALGNTFLSVREKRDGEVLSLMRARHESSIHNLVMEIKKQQQEEATKSLEALQQSRKGPVYRLQHFLQLIGEDLENVPSEDADFAEMENQIESPVDESGLKLIKFEKEEMDKSGEARIWQIGIGVVETLAGILHIIPQAAADVKPVGVGAGVEWGGVNLGSAAQAVARGLQVYASDLTYQSSNAGKKGGFLRQLQDRIQQANIAGYEIKNIDKQILAQQIRINIANQEIINQQKQIDNAQEVEDFLRSKYTNQDLYIWMEGQIRTLYYQAYTLAYELAKKAEKVFRFERGLSSSNFIQAGYWDAAYDGLLSGEKLYIGLKQLEAAYQEKRGYDYEISKPVSLRQVNPLALLQLREQGWCEFDLPEVLYDMDYPGHYARRLKSVALTVPCVVGPYTSLSCTLRLLQHKYRINAVVSNDADYPEKTDGDDDRFTTSLIPITAITAGTGQNDSGMFEVNFRDERYIPFEGAGVISRWRLELPREFHQFDYDTINDVILHIRYTSVEGGERLRSAAAKSVGAYVQRTAELSRDSGLFAVFDLLHDFPSEWYKTMHPAPDGTGRLLILNKLNDRLPVFTKGHGAKQIQATDVYLLTPASLPSAAISTTEDGSEESPLSPSDGDAAGTMKSYSAKDLDSLPVSDWQLKFQMPAGPGEIEKMWMVVRYKLLGNGS